MSGGDVPAKDVKSPKTTEEEEVERELEEEEVAGRNRV